MSFALSSRSGLSIGSARLWNEFLETYPVRLTSEVLKIDAIRTESTIASLVGGIDSATNAAICAKAIGRKCSWVEYA